MPIIMPKYLFIRFLDIFIFRFVHRFADLRWAGFLAQMLMQRIELS